MEERLTRRAPEASGAPAQLLLDVHGGLATATLNRPASLNALSFEMLEGLARALEDWAAADEVRIVVLRGAGEKAFCAGGDIRAVYDGFGSRGHGLIDFFAVEYALDFRIHTYPKPVVALIDGIVMGGGMGLAQGAALRIVGDRTRMAMPEAAIGLFPDVGGTWFLSRLAGGLGPYLGLTGRTIRAADALHCRLADVYMPPQTIRQLARELQRLAASSDVKGALREFAHRRGRASIPGAELEPMRPAIDAHFGRASVETIVASLAAEERPAYRGWARHALGALSRASPTLLKVTHEALGRARSMSLAQCFRMELGLVHGCFDQGDFLEGIRALLIDKDRQPRWHPATLAEVGPAAVEAFFTPRWPDSRHPLASLRPQGQQ